MKLLRSLLLVLTLLSAAGQILLRAGPTLEPRKLSMAELLTFLDVHAWKWTYHAEKPYTHLTARLVHFVRQPSGEFERKEIASFHPPPFDSPHTADDFTVVCGTQYEHTKFLVCCGQQNVLTFVPHGDEGINTVEYVNYGEVDGGPPRTMGSASVLMGRCKSPCYRDKLDDLLAYVAIEVETE